MRPLPEQFSLYTSFSVDFPPETVDFHINNAYKFVMRSRLGSIADDIFGLASDNVSRPQLMALYNDYVVQWWILLTLKRMIPAHGIHVTQYGVIVLKDPQGTFDPASSAERSLILQQIETDLRAAETLMLNNLGDGSWTLDNIVYRNPNRSIGDCAGPKSSGGSFGLSSIK